MNTSFSKNSLLSDAIDKLYNESPMARSCHNTSMDSSVHSMQFANMSVLQKMKPSVPLQRSFENCAENDVSRHFGEGSSHRNRVLSAPIARNSRLQDECSDNDADDGSVLLENTAQEILGAMDSHLTPDVASCLEDVDRRRRRRISPALCLTPKFIASRNARNVDDIGQDYNGNISKAPGVTSFRSVMDLSESEDALLHAVRQTTEADGDYDEAALDDVIEDDGDDIVSQPVCAVTKTNEYSLSEWTIRPVPNNHKCVMVEGLLKNMGKEVLWRSTAIVKALDKRTLQTGSGSVYKLTGPMEMEYAENSGFSTNICKAFKYGFPQNWRSMIEKHFVGDEENRGDVRKKGVKSKKAPSRTSKKEIACTPKADAYITPWPVQPLDLTKCERTRSGRVVVPSRAVAWWRGVRIYTTPHRPMEIRVDTPIENQLDSPLARPLMTANDKKKMTTKKKEDKSLFTPPTGVTAARTRRKPKNTNRVVEEQASRSSKLEKRAAESEQQPKVAENKSASVEVKASRKVTRNGRKEVRETVDERRKPARKATRRGRKMVGESEDDEVDVQKLPIRDALIRSPHTYSTHSNTAKSRKTSEKKSRRLFDHVLQDTQPDAKSNCSVVKQGRTRSIVEIKKSHCIDEGPRALIDHRDIRERQTAEGQPIPSQSNESEEDADGNEIRKDEGGRILRPRKAVAVNLCDEKPRPSGRRRRGARTATTEKGTTKSARLRKGSASQSELNTSSNSESESDETFRPSSRRKPGHRPAKGKAEASSRGTAATVRRRGRPPKANAVKSARKVVNDPIESDESDTDNEILSAKNRVQEKKDLVNQTVNNSIGLNRSLKRIHKRKNSSQSVSFINSDGEAGMLTWSEDEVQRFSKALKQISPDVVEYWTKIAELVASKNAEQCQAFHLRDVPQSVKKPKPVANKPVPPPKLIQDEDSVRIELTGGKGTFKRKRQMQTFLNAMNDDDDYDFFNSTPWLNNKRRKIAIPDSILNKDPIAPLPRVGLVNTPRTHAALQPLEEGKTPVSSLLSPDTLNNAYNEKDDLYIHRCSRLFRGKVNAHQRKKALPEVLKAGRSDSESNSRMIMELCQNDKGKENIDVDDDMEDDYFSDTEEH